FYIVFFFQAEDGIRDGHVTGVQTCALPILMPERGGTMAGQTALRVLVVDDDPLLCEMLRAALGIEGIEVLEAHHVIEAEAVLADVAPDVIVLDVGLPGIDGVFYCERLRESRRTRLIPIIAISGSDVAGSRALAVGATGFVRKPLDPLHLIRTIEELVGRTPL